MFQLLLIILKKVDDLDISKLETTPIDLKKISNGADIDVFKNFNSKDKSK